MPFSPTQNIFFWRNILFYPINQITNNFSFVLQTRVFYPSPSTSVLGCSDQRCQSLENARNAQCNTSNNRCAYDLGYGNGDGATASSAVGYYISDLVHLNGPSTPARIVFGYAFLSSMSLFIGMGIFSVPQLSREYRNSSSIEKGELFI
uniref:Xylanase inhibitor N-terminal domain-containing protein n=1 Tax=Aegilops tauschii subsp. strangulata TaxID=200361 RepID=A0A453HDM6_AEGTS